GRCVAAFADSKGVDEIVIVTREDLMAYAAELAPRFGKGKVSAVIKGGKSRTESAYLGVMQVSRKAELILIHDGARPLVTEDIISSAIKTAEAFGAALPAVPVKDTIKAGERGFVTSTPDRSSLYIAQTPQTFQAELIKAALTDAVTKGVEYTDDCAAVEKLGVRVHLSEGSYRNIKITTPEDLIIAEALLKS
ncbi:MAG: 2-C-methyl-D-erythritol 4-phosphate cytidylyltransferase, partial [Papillibacter sp.]|nr:2-C-methyl-D-erythritol 4-phosphate cytidylyltransferase [Papillibacter sp.]